jgi:lambda repressor-like predicted transcriptional regulator
MSFVLDNLLNVLYKGQTTSSFHWEVPPFIVHHTGQQESQAKRSGAQVMSETIAQRLEGLRQPAESSRAFSRRAGVTVNTLLAILRGSDPRDRTLQTIANNLAVSIVYLRYGMNGGKS